VLYTNAQSVFNKLDELKVTAALEEPDVILLTETWCGPHISNAELTIPGYQLETDMRRDRADTTAGIGGGLLVYSKMGTVLRPTDRFKGNNFNQFIEFELAAESPTKFILLYRPPNSGAENIVQLCEMLQHLDKNTVVLGDFNLPEINWLREESGPRGRPVLETAMEHSLTQLVEFSTHLKGNILDLVLVNCPERILAVNDARRLGRSDHEKIVIEIIAKIREENVGRPRTVLNWARCNYTGMREYLNEYRWKMDQTVEEDWEEFKNVIATLVEKYVPVRKWCGKNRPKWLTADLLHLIRKKKREWKNAKQYNTGPVLENYKKIEKEVARKIKYAKKKFEKDMAYSDDKNCKKFSNFLKSETKTRTPISPLKNTNNDVTTNNLEMANILNDFFASVFTAENVDNMPQKVRETNVEISGVEFTRGKLLQKLQNLKADSAPGPDNIHPRILKELRFELADPPSKLFTKSMDTGKVPLDWKVAVVTPIYKKGAKADSGNYRPVSLTSVPCKIMEPIIKDT
jgi:hypothetical protein